jgi:hypothetical protein
MKFTQILHRGFLDKVSVPILAVRGGVRLSLNCLCVRSVCAMWSRVGHRVEAVRVAQWFGDRCSSSFELLPLLGQLMGYGYGPGWALVGLHTGPLRRPHANKRKEAGWGNSARKGLEETNLFFLFQIFL